MSTSNTCAIKNAFFLVLLSGMCLTAPQDPKNAQITRYYNDNDGLGSYSFGFESSDGIKRDEAGNTNNKGTEKEFLAVKGSFSYTAPDGNTYYVEYTADENGYRPSAPRITPAAFGAARG